MDTFENQYFLGIDTSNYTTSVALFNPYEQEVIQRKKLLPVKNGQLGLRQSDAVFHHTQQLHCLVRELFEQFDAPPKIIALGVSEKPRDEEGSYMPCFTVGVNAADILSSVLGIPVYYFSHQSGHIAAAVHSSGAEYLYENEFVAFHVSGGTTEAVLVKPDNRKVFATEIIGRTLDLHAGQAIDRVGVSMGLPFPSGRELERLAFECDNAVSVKTCVKGTDCCLSGIENICAKMLHNGEDKSKIALTCLMFIAKTIEGMCRNIFLKFGEKPILFAGGVMSDTIIKQYLSSRFDCTFALPEFSTDNACGAAVLAANRYLKEFKR